MCWPSHAHNSYYSWPSKLVCTGSPQCWCICSQWLNCGNGLGGFIILNFPMFTLLKYSISLISCSILFFSPFSVSVMAAFYTYEYLNCGFFTGAQDICSVVSAVAGKCEPSEARTKCPVYTAIFYFACSWLTLQWMLVVSASRCASGCSPLPAP